LRKQLPKVNQSRIDGDDDDDADVETGDILLMLKALIGCHHYVESGRRAAKQLAVLDRRPAFFLRCANEELRQISPELPRHVLVEENASHAI